MNDVNLAPENKEATPEHGYLMAYDKKEQKAKGVKGIAANGELETLEANEANRDQFIKVDQRGNFFTNFGKNFLYQYNNPGRYSLYNMPKETLVEQAKEKIEAAQEPQNEAVRRELASTRVYNNHRFNEREVNWEQAAKYGITPDGLKNAKDSLERMLQGKTLSVWQKIPSWGVKTGMPNSPCSATRTELSSSTSTTSVRLPRSGKTTGDMS